MQSMGNLVDEKLLINASINNYKWFKLKCIVEICEFGKSYHNKALI